MCPHDGVVLDNGERMLPVLWTDVARPVWQQEPQHMLLLVRIILYENIAFMILTILRLLMHFLVQKKNRLKKCLRAYSQRSSSPELGTLQKE